MDFAIYSTQGKVRSTNEDSASFHRKAGGEFIVVLCDGMGGHFGGEIAAQTAVTTLIEEYKLAPEFRDKKKTEIHEWFRKTIDEILKLYTLTVQENDEYAEMGTTLCAAIGVGNKVYIANIGDSRAYVLFNAKFTQITDDHSLAKQLFRSGQINKKELIDHPYQNVLYNVLGYDKKYEIDWFATELIAGSKLILMSDGVYSELSDSEIVKIIMNSSSIESAVVGVCEVANLKGGKDNNTIIIGEF